MVWGDDSSMFSIMFGSQCDVFQSELREKHRRAEEAISVFLVEARENFEEADGELEKLIANANAIWSKLVGICALYEAEVAKFKGKSRFAREKLE